MCGRDTLATEVSSTSMNVAMLTVMAISHGLCFGTQGCSVNGASPQETESTGVNYGGDYLSAPCKKITKSQIERK